MMRSGIRALVLALLAPFANFFFADSAQADNALTQGFGEGRWRTEFGAATGFHSGRRDRSGDIVLKGSVEYEWPLFARATLGLRTYPLFLYMQDDPEEELWGGGFGLASRVYQNKDSRDGVFVEGGASVLFHSNHVDGNDATMDFLLEGGLGYQFKTNWHVTLQVQHISNGGLSDDNSGANSVGLAMGYTF